MSALVYAVDELSRHRRPIIQKAGMRVDLPEDAPSPLVVSQLRTPPKLRKLIKDGFQPGCGYPSRSEADFAVVTAMLRAGYPDGEILGVFMNPSNNISAKFFEKGSDGPRYLSTTLASAKDRLDRGEETGINENNGRLEVRRSKGTRQVVFNRTIKATARLCGAEQGFRVEIFTPQGSEHRELLADHFANSFNFKKAVNLAGAWTGTDRDLQLLMTYLESQSPPVQEVVKTIGWRNKTVVFPNAQLENGKFIPDTDYLYLGKLREAKLLEHDDWPTLAKELADILPQLHSPSAIVPIIGWFLATFVAPEVRKLEQGAFPLLMVFGTPEAGKTTLLESMRQLCGLDGGLHSSTSTKFANIELLSSSNTLPIVFDEHRRSDIRLHKSILYPLLREAYKAAIHSRGRADLSLVHYHLTAPVAIGGETPFRDSALVDRTIHVQLERSGKNESALERLRQLELSKFNAGMYRHAQMKDITKLWTEVEQLLPASLHADRMNIRQYHAWRVVALGLRLLEPFWTPERTTQLIGQLADFRTASSEDIAVPTKAVILETIRAIYELMKMGQIRDGREYAIKERDGVTQLWIVPALVLPLVEQYYQKIDTDLPMTRETILGRMREDSKNPNPFIARYQEHFRVGVKTAKGIAVDLNRYAEDAGVPVETWEVAAITEHELPT